MVASRLARDRVARLLERPLGLGMDVSRHAPWLAGVQAHMRALPERNVHAF